MQAPTNWSTGISMNLFPANSQMYSPDGSIGVKAMYVRSQVPQDQDLARVTVETEIPQENPITVAVHIEKEASLTSLPLPMHSA